METARAERRHGLQFILPATVLMVGIFMVPIGYVVYFSFHRNGVPTLSGYNWLATSPLFSRVLWSTLEISVLSSLVSLVLGYVMAFHLARLSPRLRAIGMAAVLLPFWTSILVKSYAFTIILGREGLINSGLAWFLGFNPELPLIFNRIGVLAGMANFLVPFVVFPVLANLLAQDRNLTQAASIMGADPFTIFWRVTFPISMPAIVAGALMTLIVSFGFFVTPALLGGSGDVMLANLIDLFTRETLNWTNSSAIAMFLLMVSIIVAALLARVPGGLERG